MKRKLTDSTLKHAIASDDLSQKGPTSINQKIDSWPFIGKKMEDVEKALKNAGHPEDFLQKLKSAKKAS